MAPGVFFEDDREGRVKGFRSRIRIFRQISYMNYELKIEREVDVPREKLFRCWTEAKLLDEWFCPKPYRTRNTVLEPDTGGRFETEIYGPEGDAFPNVGVFLEVVPNERIVTTDAFRAGWVPNPEPFMTAIVTFEDLGNGRTRYTAVARHWTAEAREKHEKMGFHDGWNAALDQLVELANSRITGAKPDENLDRLEKELANPTTT